VSDVWVNVSALAMPRRRGIVRLSSQDLFRADVLPEVLFRAWGEARRGAGTPEWLEKVARHLAERGGAPMGCTLVAVAYRHAFDVVEIVVDHPSLPIVPECQEAPVLWPEAAP